MPPLVKQLMAMSPEELSDVIYGWTQAADCMEMTGNEIVRRARKGRLPADDLVTLVDLDPETWHPLNKAVCLQLSSNPAHAEKMCEIAQEDGIWALSMVQVERAGAFEFAAELTIDDDRFTGRAASPRKALARQRAIAAAVLASIDAAPPADWWAEPAPAPGSINLVAAARNPKGYLNGFCLKHNLAPPVFETAPAMKGRKSIFETNASILWSGKVIAGQGQGRTKTAAEVEAALAVLQAASRGSR